MPSSSSGFGDTDNAAVQILLSQGSSTSRDTRRGNSCKRELPHTSQNDSLLSRTRGDEPKNYAPRDRPIDCRRFRVRHAPCRGTGTIDVSIIFTAAIMGVGQCAHELGPRARPSPTNEAIVAGGVRTEVVRQIAPWRPRPQNQEDAIEDATVIHSWHAPRLVRQQGLDGRPLIVGKFVAHDSSPSIRGT